MLCAILALALMQDAAREEIRPGRFSGQLPEVLEEAVASMQRIMSDFLLVENEEDLRATREKVDRSLPAEVLAAFKQVGWNDRMRGGAYLFMEGSRLVAEALERDPKLDVDDFRKLAMLEFLQGEPVVETEAWKRAVDGDAKAPTPVGNAAARYLLFGLRVNSSFCKERDEGELEGLIQFILEQAADPSHPTWMLEVAEAALAEGLTDSEGLGRSLTFAAPLPRKWQRPVGYTRAHYDLVADRVSYLNEPFAAAMQKMLDEDSREARIQFKEIQARQEWLSARKSRIALELHLTEGGVVGAPLGQVDVQKAFWEERRKVLARADFLREAGEAIPVLLRCEAPHPLDEQIMLLEQKLPYANPEERAALRSELSELRSQRARDQSELAQSVRDLMIESVGRDAALGKEIFSRLEAEIARCNLPDDGGLVFVRPAWQATFTGNEQVAYQLLRDHLEKGAADPPGLLGQGPRESAIVAIRDPAFLQRVPDAARVLRDIAMSETTTARDYSVALPSAPLWSERDCEAIFRKVAGQLTTGTLDMWLVGSSFVVGLKDRATSHPQENETWIRPLVTETLEKLIRSEKGVALDPAALRWVSALISNDTWERWGADPTLTLPPDLVRARQKPR
ncbi:MAG: hypothetical protein AB1486_12690 [Planctomycetota bacterium]